MHAHDINRTDDWVGARRTLLQDLTRLRTQLYADPSELPWLVEPALPNLAAGLPLRLLFASPEESAAAWSGLFDRLDGYLHTLH
jgi:hypothetical protein